MKNYKRIIQIILVSTSILVLSGCFAKNDISEVGTSIPSAIGNQSKTGDKYDNLIQVSLVAVVDGDTIKINYKGKVETVRYLLVDTPEEKKPGVCVQKFAMDAYNRNKQLINSDGGKLSLEFEKSGKRDKYGRLLAYVFVKGISVQNTLIKEGYARIAYIYDPPYKYLNKYQSDESTAKNKKLKIWSVPGFATESGFNGCVNQDLNNTFKNDTIKASLKSSSSNETEIFRNCTDLRKKFPNGVPKGHSSYQSKMDRDKDNFACER